MYDQVNRYEGGTMCYKKKLWESHGTVKKEYYSPNDNLNYLEVSVPLKMLSFTLSKTQGLVIVQFFFPKGGQENKMYKLKTTHF